MKERNIGLLAFVNGRQYRLGTLDGTVDGVFELSSNVRSENGLRWISPVIRNISGGELCFGKAFVSVTLPAGPYEAFTQYSKWSGENAGSWQKLEGRGIYLSHANARTTEGNTPYLAMRMCGRPEGMAFHVLPLGDWRIRVWPQAFSNTEPQMEVDLGISDEALAYRMQPGETWELPEVIIQEFRDFDASTLVLHKFLKKHLMPSQKALPIEYNTWLDVYERLDVQRMRSQLAAAKEIGCEVFVVDAGWFGDEPGWSGVGDWREKTDSAFCGRMADFADEVRAAGLGFGIWVEPERFQEGVPVLREHPEWFVYVPETKQYRIDLEQPAAYEYQKNLFLSLIAKYKLAYIKTDMNAQHGIDETGASHFRYAKLFYKLIDEIRALHPEVVIENCSSGAMRCDLESMKHFDVAFPSDSANPFTQTDMLIGFLRRFLPGQMLRWITPRELPSGAIPFFGSDRRPVITPIEATWEEYMGVDMESLMAVNFVCGQYGFTGDLASLSPESRAMAKKYVGLFKDRRNFMRRAEGCCLMDTPEFKAVELCAEEGAVVVYQWLVSNALGDRVVYPLGLHEDAMYKVGDEKRSGRDIMADGITVHCGEGQHSKWRASLVMIDRI